VKPNANMERVLDGKRYRVATAALLASDAYWDGHNFERRGRNTYLYRTPRGGYFVVRLTQWQGEQDHLAPVMEEEARALYETTLTEHDVTYEEAFPDVAVEDA